LLIEYCLGEIALTKTLLIVAVFLLTSIQLGAASIRIITGADVNGNLQANGGFDQNWQISTNGTTYLSPVVAFPAQIFSPMDTVSAGAKWITDPSVRSDSENTGWGTNNPVIFETVFDLTGFDLATTTLSGFWRLADDTLSISINGILVPGTAVSSVGSWSTDQAINVGSSFFNPGVNNVLTVVGSSRNSRWDAFWFDATVQDAAPTGEVPEPSSMLLLGAGLGIVALRGRKIRS
jgi:hypothetical protein